MSVGNTTQPLTDCGHAAIHIMLVYRFLTNEEIFFSCRGVSHTWNQAACTLMTWKGRNVDIRDKFARFPQVAPFIDTLTVVRRPPDWHTVSNADLLWPRLHTLQIHNMPSSPVGLADSLHTLHVSVMRDETNRYKDFAISISRLPNLTDLTFLDPSAVVENYAMRHFRRLPALKSLKLWEYRCDLTDFYESMSGVKLNVHANPVEDNQSKEKNPTHVVDVSFMKCISEESVFTMRYNLFPLKTHLDIYPHMGEVATNEECAKRKCLTSVAMVFYDGLAIGDDKSNEWLDLFEQTLTHIMPYVTNVQLKKVIDARPTIVHAESWCMRMSTLCRRVFPNAHTLCMNIRSASQMFLKFTMSAFPQIRHLEWLSTDLLDSPALLALAFPFVETVKLPRIGQYCVRYLCHLPNLHQIIQTENPLDHENKLPARSLQQWRHALHHSPAFIESLNLPPGHVFYKGGGRNFYRTTPTASQRK